LHLARVIDRVACDPEDEVERFHIVEWFDAAGAEVSDRPLQLSVLRLDQIENLLPAQS
jgi:hypothetical protein